MNHPPAGVPVCYRHPGRETHISCQRCGKHICPDCMREASVGFHCPDCVAEGRRSVRQATNPYGGRPSARPELTTYALMAVNLAVFVALLVAGGAGSALGRALLLVPLGSCRPNAREVYTGIGDGATCANLGTWVEGVATGAPWQLITSGFAHVSALHIGLNMLMLYLIGPQVERVMGRGRFLALYGLALLGGSTAVMWLSEPYSSTLGASGAVFGLIGALLVVVLKVGGDPRQLLLWLGLNVVISVVGAAGISWQGHLGGFLAGVAAALVIAYAPRERRVLLQTLGLVALTGILLALIGVRVLVLG